MRAAVRITARAIEHAEAAVIMAGLALFRERTGSIEDARRAELRGLCAAKRDANFPIFDKFVPQLIQTLSLDERRSEVRLQPLGVQMSLRAKHEFAERHGAVLS